MDPNVSLERQRELTERILELDERRDQNGSMSLMDAGECAELGVELAELVEALHESIYRLIDRVRAHPDYVFGAIFTRDDFPRSEVPEDFNASVEEDLLVQHGNEHIEWMTDREEQ